MVDQAVPTRQSESVPAPDVIARAVADAAGWKDQGRPDSVLYDAEAVAEVEAAAGADGTRLPGDLRDFLAQSRGRLVERRRNRRILIGVGAAVAVAALVAGVSSAVGRDDGPYADVAAALDRVQTLRATDTTASAQLAAAVAAANPDDPSAVAALRDTQSDSLRRDLDPVTASTVASTPTGRSALVGEDGAVRIVDRGRVVSTVTAGPGDRSLAAALNGQGTRLVTSGSDGSIRAWTLDPSGAARPAGTLAATGSPTTAIALASDRAWAVAADATGEMRIVSLAGATPRLLATIPGTGREITALAVAPDRAIVASGGPARPLILTDISNPDASQTIPAPGGTASLRGVAFAPDGTTAVTTDESGSAQLWTVGDAAVRPIGTPLDPPAPGGATATFSPDGTRLAITAQSGAVALLDVSRPATPRTLASPARVVGRALRTSAFADGNTLVTATSGAPLVWTLPTGLLTGGFGTPTDASCATARPYCASGFLRGPVRVFQRDGATAVRQIGVIDAPDHFDGASMSPDGRWMITVDSRHLAQLWDITTIGKPVAVGPAVALGPQQRNHLVFSPDSSRLLTGFGSGDTVRVWRVSSTGLLPAGDVSAARAGARGPVTAAGFSDDSRTIVLGTQGAGVVTAELG